MNITFLGTAGMLPTKERNVQSIYIEYKGEGILLDCGEGTQRQITIAGLNAQKIRTILISHWHGDHVSGLVGLIQTLGNFSNGEKTVKLFGPEGTRDHLNNMMNSCIFETKLNLDVVEIPTSSDKQVILDNKEYFIEAVSLDHSVPCIGYSFVKKARLKLIPEKTRALGLKEGPLLGRLQRGEDVVYNGMTIRPSDVGELIPQRKVSFIFDTQICDGCYDLAENADLLISEAVYKNDLEHKAIEYKHMTALQAARVASESGVKELILTHFSQRYKDVSELEDEAKVVFPNTRCAFDFMKVELQF